MDVIDLLYILHFEGDIDDIEFLLLLQLEREKQARERRRRRRRRRRQLLRLYTDSRNSRRG